MQQWLSSVFDGEQKISDYTINSQTIDLLYEAAVEAEEDRRRVQLVAEGYRQRAEEYKAESEQSNQICVHTHTACYLPSYCCALTCYIISVLLNNHQLFFSQ